MASKSRGSTEKVKPLLGKFRSSAEMVMSVLTCPKKTSKQKLSLCICQLESNPECVGEAMYIVNESSPTNEANLWTAGRGMHRWVMDPVKNSE